MKIQIQLKNGQDYTDVYTGSGSWEDWRKIRKKLPRAIWDSNAHGLYVVSLQFKDVNNIPAHWTFYTWSDPMPHV